MLLWMNAESVETFLVVYSHLQVPVTVKELATVTHIHFSPASPYNFAVTSGARVSMLR